MDDETRERQRESSTSPRENRWSMSSHRLEQIVAELMVPIKDAGKSFDRNLNELLEDYLTEQGLRALASAEAGEEPPKPNYAELAMILAVSAANWGKKVDCLYDMVVSYEHRLEASTARASEGEGEGEEGAEESPSGRRRRRDTGGAGAPAAEFAAIALEPSAQARREAAPHGPPPTLPRLYAELEPRAQADDERALRDYHGEVIGMLPDFHVSWRLHDGLLVDELEAAGPGPGPAPAPAPGPAPAALQPLSLAELQEACARGSPPAGEAGGGAPPASPAGGSAPPPSPASAACRRKRKSSENQVEPVLAVSNVDIHIGEDALRRLAEERPYEVSERWVRRVVCARAAAILHARRALAPPPLDFRGFDSSWMDIGGFRGWAPAEGAASRAAAGRAAAGLAAAARRLSDADGGFFERSSSLGDDARRSASPTSPGSPDPYQGAEEAGTLDLREYERRVARALPAPPAALRWAALCGGSARARPDVARCFLSVLMQVTRGELELVPGAPLVPGDFSVRAVRLERGSSGLGDDDDDAP